MFSILPGCQQGVKLKDASLQTLSFHIGHKLLKTDAEIA